MNRARCDDHRLRLRRDSGGGGSRASTELRAPATSTRFRYKSQSSVARGHVQSASSECSHRAASCPLSLFPAAATNASREEPRRRIGSRGDARFNVGRNLWPHRCGRQSPYLYSAGTRSGGRRGSPFSSLLPESERLMPRLSSEIIRR